MPNNQQQDSKNNQQDSNYSSKPTLGASQGQKKQDNSVQGTKTAEQKKADAAKADAAKRGGMADNKTSKSA